MDALQYLIVQPETRVVVFLIGWSLGIVCGALLAMAARS